MTIARLNVNDKATFSAMRRSYLFDAQLRDLVQRVSVVASDMGTR
jgi:hypothetical protein